MGRGINILSRRLWLIISAWITGLAAGALLRNGDNSAYWFLANIGLQASLVAIITISISRYVATDSRPGRDSGPVLHLQRKIESVLLQLVELQKDTQILRSDLNVFQQIFGELREDAQEIDKLSLGIERVACHIPAMESRLKEVAARAQVTHAAQLDSSICVLGMEALEHQARVARREAAELMAELMELSRTATAWSEKICFEGARAEDRCSALGTKVQALLERFCRLEDRLSQVDETSPAALVAPLTTEIVLPPGPFHTEDAVDEPHNPQRAA